MGYFYKFLIFKEFFFEVVYECGSAVLIPRRIRSVKGEGVVLFSVG